MSLSLTTKHALRPLLAQCSRAAAWAGVRSLPAAQHDSLRQFWGFSKQQKQRVQAIPRDEPQIHNHSAVSQSDVNPLKQVTVNIDGNLRAFDPIFLRDSCACPQCRDPHSKQKLFQTSDIPQTLEADCQALKDNNKAWTVEISWTNDVPGYGSGHRTRLSIDWLRRALDVELELRGAIRKDERELWDGKKISENNKWVDYKDYMNSDEALHDALFHLHKYGLLFLKGVPESEESVIEIAGRIGNLKDTFYGRTWDVRSKAKAENIAYTHQFLGLHMDLLYTSNPPYLQFLHSLRARSPGGESLFSDSFYAANKLHEASPFQFRTLCTFPVTYEYHHPTQHYHFTRPTIELFPYPKYSEPTNLAINRINWSPPFQGPFEARIGSENQSALRNYITAANSFETILSKEENLFEYRLAEGECVVFDNRRVLHARRAFDASKGERWLKGAYVDDDVFFSKLRVLQEKYEGSWVADGVLRRSVK